METEPLAQIRQSRLLLLALLIELLQLLTQLHCGLLIQQRRAQAGFIRKSGALQCLLQRAFRLCQFAIERLPLIFQPRKLTLQATDLGLRLLQGSELLCQLFISLLNAGLYLLTGVGDLAVAKQRETLLAHLAELRLALVLLLLTSGELLLLQFCLLLQGSELGFPL
jgi:hypothetical protein